MILFSCSPPQVKRVNRFQWLRAKTMPFHPRKCLFGVSLKKFDFTGSVTTQNRQKVGVVYGFPAKLGESIKTHISVKSRDIDTKFEPRVETKAYTLDFGSKVTHSQITMPAAAIMKKFKL
jgi:hypothetical protein